MVSGQLWGPMGLRVAKFWVAAVWYLQVQPKRPRCCPHLRMGGRLEKGQVACPRSVGNLCQVPSLHPSLLVLLYVL